MRPAVAAALSALSAAEPLPLRVAGGCMAPALRDAAVARFTRPARVWPGDVVVFATTDGALVAHRLIGALPGRLYTQGDHEPLPDGAFPRGRLVGRLDVEVAPADRLRALLRFARLLGRAAWRRVA